MNALRALAKPQPAFIPKPAPKGLLQRKCACGNHIPGGGECAECRKRDDGRLRRTKVNAEPLQTVPPTVHEVLRSPGQPLSADARAFFEPRFGRDFSSVRVHTGAWAAASAAAVGARAYTIGDRLVFGDGEYRAGTANGRKLLAHELTHTLQQGARSPANLRVGDARDGFEREAEEVAESVLRRDASAPVPFAREGLEGDAAGLMQRTPAEPTYGGVTGVRDLSKIRIDAVEDFLASSLTAPRAVNVHLSDARVTHLTWMLYDPNDQMMTGSFSTTPTHARATSEPFMLQPSHFSGGGFVAGKYILRCSGLDAQHRPVVYADRDFNVLRSDLTTGTALPTTYGDLTFAKYAKTDANPPANPRFSVDVELRFLPKTTVPCADVAFIQSMRTIDGQGRSQHNTINSEQDARQTPLAWSIDHAAGAASPFYITERDPATGRAADDARFGLAGRGGPSPAASSLIDRPSWHRENFASFETCAICRSGGNRGQVYGCATWGYSATAAGRVTLMPRSFRQMPSGQFDEAGTAWNTWRAPRPAATRPEALPGLHSP